MASDYTGAHQAEVRHSARAVKHWICAIPFRDELGNVTTKRMQDRLEAIIAGVEQWQEGTFLSLSQLEKAIKGFGNVTCYSVKGLGSTCGLQLPLVRGAVNSLHPLDPTKIPPRKVPEDHQEVEEKH
ncbi:hypothetical protein JG687_00011329 [Phytophthora cactorum]|uniref:Uncharacterized protein n=1 Tax=Phytophthora cactorum TaxID=29920 RepID=A0A8T1UA09_9STRA|nr:hypothetical protein JG687_00011329 [Phytophthora cactorum]